MNQQPGPAELLDLLSFWVNTEIWYLDDDTFNEVNIRFKALKVR